MGKAKTAQGEKKIMPLISVIMGVHNSETDMLLSAVGSVLSQSVSDIELIICDDGSENGIGKTLGCCSLRFCAYYGIILSDGKAGP